MAQGFEIKEGTFVISGPNGKRIKLLSNERIDADFLCRIFGVESDDILGFRTHNYILIRLGNPRFSEVIDGQLCTLELYSQSPRTPRAPPRKKRRLSNAPSAKEIKVEPESKFEDEQNNDSSEDNSIVRKTKKTKLYKLKSPKSAWMLFNAFKTTQLNQLFPSMLFGERTKRSGKSWKRMQNREKEEWHQKAKEEKKTYERLKQEFAQHQDHTKIPPHWLKMSVHKTKKPKLYRLKSPKSALM